MNPNNPASKYNNVRHHVFSTYNKYGYDSALELILYFYRLKELTSQGRKGLCAELAFYHRYKNKFGLTVAGDVGDHADFAGAINGKNTRFDVTTSGGWDFKDFNDYSRFMPSLDNEQAGFQYIIPVYDGHNFELRNALDLRFEHCTYCGGCLIPILLLGNEEMYNGNRTFFAENAEILFCNKCHQIFNIRHLPHSGYLRPENDIAERINMNYWGTEQENQDHSAEINNAINAEYCSMFRCFHKESSGNFMAIATQDCLQTGYKNQESYWAICLHYIHPLVLHEIPCEIELNTPILPCY